MREGLTGARVSPHAPPRDAYTVRSRRRISEGRECQKWYGQTLTSTSRWG